MRRQTAIGHLTLAAACASLSAAALAGQYEVACTWLPPVSATGDPGAKEAATFFLHPNELAYFRLSPELEKAENIDPHKTQELYIPTLRLHVFPNRVTIIAHEPNIAGLKGRKAQIHIDINRYSLRSAMVLEMAEKGSGKLVAFWRREGQCFKKEF